MSYVPDVAMAAVSLREVAESDFLPLGVVALVRLACAATALSTLLCVNWLRALKRSVIADNGK